MKQTLRMKRDLLFCRLATLCVSLIYANTRRRQDTLRDLRRLTEITRKMKPAR